MTVSRLTLDQNAGGVCAETVEDYKYLALTINWTSLETQEPFTGLRLFNMSWMMLRVFYESAVASNILCAVACRGGRLCKRICKAGKVVSAELDLRIVLDNP